ncbi:CoxG family protein [Roseospira navarrensis]|uniref:Carbon monoxide dehydrogenase n=1 Tax=Roseospira navarrensis TaxID=140058 RepID=A0A7X1ZAL3_9PROT|nr:carbon monoxide dehydrogenase subunit G [Roseospira navarrensis]MQX35039.1 carbon monoxide dehydrogenase [Roseospira navarrensis]
MDISGEHRIPAPRPTVWAALNDAETLKHCIDGCESLEWVSDTELAAKLKAKVGPVSARFTGTVTLSEINPPESYVISGQGQGGAAGFVKGSATVTLAEDGPDATVMTYTAHATVGGKLASVGGRLVKGVASKTADDFFRAFSQRVGGVPEAEAEEAAETVPAPEAVAPVPDVDETPAGEAVPLSPAGRSLPPARVPKLTTPPPVLLRLTGGGLVRVLAWGALALAILGGAIAWVS